MPVTITSEDVRARRGVSETDWPDGRVDPVLKVALARARAVASDASLTGNAATLWRAGVVALTWSMLGDSSSGYATGAVKIVADGDIRTEFETRTKSGSGQDWMAEAIAFIPALNPQKKSLSAVPLRRADEVEPETFPIVAAVPGGDVNPDLIPVEFDVQEAANPLVVSLAPVRVHPSYVDQVILDASSIGALRLGNITVSEDRTTVSIALAPDQDGNPVSWLPGDWGRLLIRPE